MRKDFAIDIRGNRKGEIVRSSPFLLGPGSWVVLLLFVLILIPSPGRSEPPKPSDEPSKPEESKSKIDLSGRLRASYDYRELGGDTDSDAYGYWHLRGRNFFEGHVDVYTSGRLHEDLDDTEYSLSEDPFVGMEDTSRESDARVMQLYADIHNDDNTMRFRGGRQYVDVADYIQMDGGQAILSEQKRIGGRVFLGQPVSFYTSVSGDLFGGASLVGRPWSGNRSRLTFARYEDDSEDETDNHFFLDVRQQVVDDLRSRGYVSVINEEFRMGGLDLYYTSSEGVFDVVLGGRRWGDFEAGTRAYSPLYDVLGELEPYSIVYGRLTKEIMPWLFFAPGLSLRFPDDSDSTNREYKRFDVSLILEPDRALNASVGVEYWDVEDEDQFLGVSGEVRYRHGKLWEITVGAAYLDYEYRTFSDFSISTVGGDILVTSDGTRVEISPDVFTYFIRGKWNINKTISLRLEGEVEDDSTEDDLGYRIRSSVEVRY